MPIVMKVSGQVLRDKLEALQNSHQAIEDQFEAVQISDQGSSNNEYHLKIYLVIWEKCQIGGGDQVDTVQISKYKYTLIKVIVL